MGKEKSERNKRIFKEYRKGKNGYKKLAKAYGLSIGRIKQIIKEYPQRHPDGT